MNTKHIVGPPGTGKTTTLMDYLERMIARGIGPDQIAYVSFTKAAISTVRDKIAERFGLTRDDTPYFGTLHSLGYRAIGISRNQVLTGKQWSAFCKLNSYRHSPSDGIPDEDLTEPLGVEEGDTFRRFHDWRRNSLLEFDPALKTFSATAGDLPGWSRNGQRLFCSRLEEYKTENTLFDFPDFLTELLATGWVPPVRVLIVDESQDLSPLQARVVTTWAERIGNLLLAYDPDQAIYGFQGADPTWLLEMDGARQFLTQSWRVPREPAKLAAQIIRRNRNRYANTWEPKPEPGEVKRGQDLDSLVRRCGKEGGSWYFLGRNRCYLSRFTSLLMDEGIPFVNLRGHTPKAGVPVITAIRLATGAAVTLDAFGRMVEEIPAKPWFVHGAKAKIKRVAEEFPARPVTIDDLGDYGALPELAGAVREQRTCLDPLGMIGPDKRAYYSRVFLRFGMEGLTRRPTVTVGTEHSVKGGEAENVVLDLSMSRRTYDSYDADPEPERRVWYVGVSRTERRLFLLEEPERGEAFDEI